MNILSVYGGIGSMIIGAKEQNYDIVAGFDDRKFFNTGTFNFNFQKNFFSDFSKLREEIDLSNIDIVIGHTSCGNFSKMNNRLGLEKLEEKAQDKGDIPNFIKITKSIQPNFFILDNLPKALLAVDVHEWHQSFPNYDIYFEWISNYNYGNIQKGRKRLFIIGTKKELGYVFIPGEKENNKTLRDVIGDLPLYDDIEEINHIHYPDDIIISMKNKHIEENVKEIRNLTLGEWKEYIKNIPARKRFHYRSDSGSIKYKLGNYKMDLDRHSGVLTGEGVKGVGLYREDNLSPLTVREKARIQGCPDSFIFKPMNFKYDWSSHKKLRLQTGKFIPVQFCTFLTGQIKKFIEGKLDLEDYSRRRVSKHNDIITSSKYQYCRIAKYSNKEKTCRFCWINCGG